MTDFNEILKNSLLVVNDGYRRALDDLKLVVSEVRYSIKANAGQEFTIELSEIEAKIDGTVFQVYLDTNVDDPRAEIYRITNLQILPSGYPIHLGVYNRSQESFMKGDESFDGIDDIRRFFAEQLSDPNSRLIQLIGFTLRRRQV